MTTININSQTKRIQKVPADTTYKTTSSADGNDRNWDAFLYVKLPLHLIRGNTIIAVHDFTGRWRPNRYEILGS